MTETENIKVFLEKALRDVLHFWTDYTIDDEFGGFAGEVNNEGEIIHGAEKGLVLNTRILWTFSAAYNFFHEEHYLQLAHRAYEYIINHFWDQKNDGLYWAVDHAGNVTDDRKKFYGQGFGIYGFSEYYQASGKVESLDFAIKLFELVEKYSYDEVNGGYREALSAEWLSVKDMRLSKKDANLPKSMNTHLHILEAYSKLYRNYPVEKLRDRLKSLVRVFLDHILDNDSWHLKLFFEMDWQARSNIISFGHDIEGAWLINEAASLVGDPELVNEVQKKTIKIVDAVLNKGVADDHSIYYEKNYDSGILNKERHYWVQAEAMVGLLNAFENTNDEQYFEKFEKLWKYIYEKIIDKKNGGWFGIVEDNGLPGGNDIKAGFWMCPYHNSRALMESVNRINHMGNTSNTIKTAI